MLRKIESGKIKCFLRFLIAIIGSECKKKRQISLYMVQLYFKSKIKKDDLKSFTFINLYIGAKFG
jgi:hypothetical protein